ncbi:MAG: efflux RND transporter permease subunit [Cellvibrionaceae bacterium]|nr:efflux RND transporter permease subunit [Cellvibrionaceae bacterium]
MNTPTPQAPDAHLDTSRGIIAWFARNPVAANLLMMAIIIMGLYSAVNIRKQMFPTLESNTISVNAVYRGASPQEVEEGITTKLEEALQSIDGIKKMRTTSRRGNANATLEVMESYEVKTVLEDVKSAVDSISSFPAGMEPARVSHSKFRQQVMWVNVAGDLSIKELKQLGETLHDELRALPEVNITEFYAGPAYEIAIEVSQDKLREHKLNFAEIAIAVRNFSTNRSAGEIRAEDGIVSVRVEEQAYIGAEYENIPLRTLDDGTELRLKDVATVDDGFEQGVNYTKLDGINALTFFIGASEDQSITDVSKVVNAYLEAREKTLPQGVRFEPWVDLTYYLNGRLNMMLENMLMGGILVFIILSIFLRLKLAFWVMMGLPVAFLGATAFLPVSWINVTINIGSLFAFIMVLGVVVDDAIIIGESVYTETQNHGLSTDNVIRGAQRVAVPATFGVLTTVAAFLPMVFSSGPQSAIPHAIGFVVVLCLLFSLVESKLILPAHLANLAPENKQSRNPLNRLRLRVDSGLRSLIENHYRLFLKTALKYRYTVLASFSALIIVIGATFSAGAIRMIGFPKIPSDWINVILEMAPDAPEDALLVGMLNIEQTMREVDREIVAEFGQPMVEKILNWNQSRTTGRIEARLVLPEDRPVNPLEFSRRLREKMPDISGVKNIAVHDTIGEGDTQDGDLNFRIKGRNIEELRAAAAIIKAELATMKGVSEINDSETQAAREIQFKLKPVAHSLGLTTSEVANQASYSLYGLEAQRIMRDRQEIRVMVRYPKEQRNSLDAINNVLIRTPEGGEVPLSEVSHIEFTQADTQIYREDGNRAISIWATVDFDVAESFKIADQLKTTTFADVKQRFPSVSFEESGKLKEDRDGVSQQILGTLVILLPIYVLLALPLKSYFQPLMIMSVIPFGVIGAILGHLLLGMDLSQMSIMGITAVIGVVVNDSLVMVDYVNRAIQRGESLSDAVLHAGQRRFRAIILTSLTTFIGLMPILFETSLQAQIVIPMAVSLAFGVLFATVVTLILVPSLYMISEDIAKGIQKLKSKFKGSGTLQEGY